MPHGEEGYRVLASGTEIGGSFSAQIDPDPCSVTAPDAEAASGLETSGQR